jgi:hypothetical protein
MELGLDATKLVGRTSPRARRITRGAWWFARMRQIVDHAMDWPAAGEPRPEQTWLPGARREVRV